MQKGDVYETFADVTDLNKTIDYQPDTTIEEGVKKFVNWFKSY